MKIKKPHFNNFKIIFSLLFILWLIAEIFIKFEPLNNYPNDDSASFLYIGRSILQGKIPYVDTWDHKGPLLYYIDALGLFIFGLWGVWFVQFVLTFLGFGVAYLNAKSLFGNFPSLIGILSGFYLLDLFAAGNITEEYSAIFALFSFGLYVAYQQDPTQKKDLLGLGALFMCTFLTRANNIGFQSALLVSIGGLSILQKNHQRLKSEIIWVINGMLIVLLPCIIYFGINQAVWDFYDQAFRYNLIYIETTKSILDFKKFFSPPIHILTCIWVATYGSILFGLKKNWKNFQTIESKVIVVLLFAFPIEFLLSNISGRNYDHYYLTWIPYVIFASAFFIHQIQKTIKPTKITEKFLIAFVFIGYLIIWKPQQTFFQYTSILNHFIYNRANGIEQHHPLADFVHENSTEHDTVLRWGFGRWLNYVIERDSPTRFLYQLELFTPGYTTDDMLDEFAHDVISKKPKFIIEAVNYFIPIDSKKLPSYGDIVHPKYFEIVKFIEENYHIVKLKFYAEGQNEEDRWIKVWMLNNP